MILGGAGPWWSASAAVQVTQKPAAPALLVICGLVSIALIVRQARGKATRATLGWLTGVGAVCACMCVGTFALMVETSNQTFGLVRPAWGIYVSFVASIALCVACAILLLASSRGRTGTSSVRAS